MLEIEDITTADIELVSQLFVSVFSNPPWDEDWELDWAYERLEWIYNSQGFKGYIARNKDRIVGAIMGHFVPFHGEKGFQIVEFFVQAEHQNQGVGTMLLNKLELDLVQSNYNFVNLLTAKDSSAESFYAKYNYQRNSKIVLLRKKL